MLRSVSLLLTLVPFLFAGACREGQTVSIPCRAHEDSFVNLLDNELILIYGGRGGASLHSKYEKFVRYREKITYPDRVLQSWGYCEVLFR